MSSKCVFAIDGREFKHIQVLSLEQSFEVLDGKNSGRVLTGEMKRDIIGTYFNYSMVLKPEFTPEGMKEYAILWDLCSNPVDFHRVTVPFDLGVMSKSTKTFDAYITSGKRQMLKFDYKNVDYWKEGVFNFIAMQPTKSV